MGVHDLSPTCSGAACMAGRRDRQEGWWPMYLSIIAVFSVTDDAGVLVVGARYVGQLPLQCEAFTGRKA